MTENRKRQSWANWHISSPFEQQKACSTDGVMDKRCFVSCPIEGCTAPKINVAFASAVGNLSLTCRQHLKRYHQSTVSLPLSKRLRVNDVNELTEEIKSAKKELVDVREQSRIKNQDIMQTLKAIDREIAAISNEVEV